MSLTKPVSVKFPSMPSCAGQLQQEASSGNKITNIITNIFNKTVPTWTLSLSNLGASHTVKGCKLLPHGASISPKDAQAYTEIEGVSEGKTVRILVPNDKAPFLQQIAHPFSSRAVGLLPDAVLQGIERFVNIDEARNQALGILYRLPEGQDHSTVLARAQALNKALEKPDYSLGARRTTPEGLAASKIQSLQLCAALSPETISQIQGKLTAAWELIDDPADKKKLIDFLIKNPTRAEATLDQAHAHLAARKPLTDWKPQ